MSHKLDLIHSHTPTLYMRHKAHLKACKPFSWKETQVLLYQPVWNSYRGKALTSPLPSASWDSSKPRRRTGSLGKGAKGPFISSLVVLPRDLGIYSMPTDQNSKLKSEIQNYWTSDPSTINEAPLVEETNATPSGEKYFQNTHTHTHTQNHTHINTNLDY